MIGISIKKTIGIGDALQFSSVPENYFRHTKKLLYDVSQPWFFDHNPYISRSPDIKPSSVIEMWNYNNPTPKPRNTVFTCMAERHGMVVGVPYPVMKYPRLYRFEEFPFKKREMILVHTVGVSHNKMPDHVIDHILKKYKDLPMAQIGLPGEPDIGIPKIKTETMWDLAKVISEARIFIGMDSGPSWVACCYPDIVVKKVRNKPSLDVMKDWVPLMGANIHSYWDDRMFSVHNISEDDVGFTSSYRRI